tara:strand:- start:323 stop:682 length:360 start_codon:yes stop_codon:yes gene_type:complete
MSIMKCKILLLLILMIFSKPLLGLKFINGLEDIPLFKNMEYVDDSLVLFDKVDGRYVSTEVRGNYNYDEVISFYKKILPNLGWKEIKPLIFERSKEILELKTTVSQNEISIIFSVYPSK